MTNNSYLCSSILTSSEMGLFLTRLFKVKKKGTKGRNSKNDRQKRNQNCTYFGIS